MTAPEAYIQFSRKSSRADGEVTDDSTAEFLAASCASSATISLGC